MIRPSAEYLRSALHNKDGMPVAWHNSLAVLGMVVVVFCATAWTAVPLVGTLLGTFPTMDYLIILAKGDEFTGRASAGGAALAAAFGLLAAIVVLFVLSLAPRHGSWKLSATCEPTSTARTPAWPRPSSSTC